jgi:hemerythrin-like domain-containing protein
MLEVAERVAELLDRHEPVEPETLSGLLEIFRMFADRCHHGKEEDLLFPLLEKKGVPRDGGPIGVMLHEHDVGRSFVRQMLDAGEGYAGGDKEAGARWAIAVRGYIPLLRQHIQKENDILFVMAENVLTAEEQVDLARKFEKAEVEKMGAGTHERLHAVMDELAAKILTT